MPLESVQSLMQRARSGGYAVGYFESWNLESLQGVLDAAEETRSPVFIGFNGDFLSGSDRLCRERLELYAAAGVAAAVSASVPCGLVFNECARDDWVEAAIGLGFNLVVPSDPSASLDDCVRRVRTLTEVAHARGVSVEAEVGELPCGVACGGAGGSLTDPDQAAAFVAATGVDLLAVSAGNVHIQVQGEQPLDLDHLAAIRERVSVPFTLHGGTGIAADSLRESLALGVAKVNYGTYLKQRYLRAVREAVSSDEINPHALLGMGGAADVMVAVRLAVRDAVLERIGTLGCCGKAGHPVPE